jgi:hypothetical protein
MGFKQDSPLKKDWIQGAIKRPGAFRKKAEEAGMSTKAFANKVIANKEDYSTRTGRQAELAETLMGMNRNSSSPINFHKPEDADHGDRVSHKSGKTRKEIMAEQTARAKGSGQKESPINRHDVNSWEEEDVKRGRKLETEGHKGHAEALFDDAHDSYNWHPGMDTHAEHNSPIKNAGHYIKAYNSMPHRMESVSQEREDLMDYNPVDDHASPVERHKEGHDDETVKLDPVVVTGKKEWKAGAHKLGAYEGVDPDSLHPYDDGAGGIDYEAMARDEKLRKEALKSLAKGVGVLGNIASTSIKGGSAVGKPGAKLDSLKKRMPSLKKKNK